MFTQFQMPVFSGIDEFAMFEINAGKLLLSEVKWLRANGKYAEAKAMMPRVRKAWGKDLYYFNKKQRGGTVNNFDTKEDEDTPQARASRIEKLAAFYAPQLGNIDDHEDSDSPFPLKEVEVDYDMA
jgi:hypothetical protein